MSSVVVGVLSDVRSAVWRGDVVQPVSPKGGGGQENRPRPQEPASVCLLFSVIVAIGLSLLPLWVSVAMGGGVWGRVRTGRRRVSFSQFCLHHRFTPPGDPEYSSSLRRSSDPQTPRRLMTCRGGGVEGGGRGDDRFSEIFYCGHRAVRRNGAVVSHRGFTTLLTPPSLTPSLILSPSAVCHLPMGGVNPPPSESAAVNTLPWGDRHGPRK